MSLTEGAVSSLACIFGVCKKSRCPEWHGVKVRSSILFHELHVSLGVSAMLPCYYALKYDLRLDMVIPQGYSVRRAARLPAEHPYH